MVPYWFSLSSSIINDEFKRKGITTFQMMKLGAFYYHLNEMRIKGLGILTNWFDRDIQHVLFLLVWVETIRKFVGLYQ
jgi:hypothetical protein